VAQTKDPMKTMADQLGVVDERTAALIVAVEAMQLQSNEELVKIWTTLSSIAGLDGLSTGLAEVVEVLAPLRQLVPPTTALELEPGVAEANATIRRALGVFPDRLPNPDRLPTGDWEQPVRYIGEADPSADPASYEEQVA
jgi:hypothetical protein